jgi:hypothetical protein
MSVHSDYSDVVYILVKFLLFMCLKNLVTAFYWVTLCDLLYCSINEIIHPCMVCLSADNGAPMASLQCPEKDGVSL